MAGKQAYILTPTQMRKALIHIRKTHRHKTRDRLIFLLSFKAGLRACEIANLNWSMLLDAFGNIAKYISLYDSISKKRSGRTIPIHENIKPLLLKLLKEREDDPHVVLSERGEQMTPNSIVNWFTCLYKQLGFCGCSSHSGRRTFITNGARLIHKAGGSLRDIQQLAGHRSIEMTQRYIEGFAPAKLKLISLI